MSSRETTPPPGIVVLRSSELDPLFGRSDRWGYRGTIDGTAVYRCGLESHAAACLAAWVVADRRRGPVVAGSAIVPLAWPTRVNLDTLAPLVRELSQWLEPDDWPAALLGLIRSAPAELLADVRAELGRRRGAAVPWTLAAIVRHALLPLAELSLVNGQPVIPELGAALVGVLADPRLAPSQRRDVENVLLDSEDLESELADQVQGA